jgi:hypothetical protein
MDSFLKCGLNILDGSDEKPQMMKREPKFVRKQTFGAVHKTHDRTHGIGMKSQQKSAPPASMTASGRKNCMIPSRPDTGLARSSFSIMHVL